MAAEQLFAHRGIAAVSVRDIVAAAGQRNISAVHYYFGSKHGLVQALLRHRMQSINERRTARLDALGRSGVTQDLRTLVEAWVCPLVESVVKGSHYARFIARALASYADDAVRTLDVPETVALRQVRAQLEAALSQLPVAIRRQRLRLAVNTWTQAAATYEQDLEQGQQQVLEPTLWAEDLVNMIVGMLSAPLPPRAYRGAGRASRPRARGASSIEAIDGA